MYRIGGTYYSKDSSQEYYKQSPSVFLQGDSGGPFVCRDPGSSGEKWKLFGITSWGDDCGDVGKPGIYTRVLRYLSWIQNILDKN